MTSSFQYIITNLLNCFYIGITVVLFIGCRETDCKKLPSSFKSFDQAETIIKKTEFTFTDNINTSKSSWIKGASFYSCGKMVGFFILKTDKENYIYQNMPIEVWNSFKDANSFGSYYNNFIKHHYQLVLTE